MTSNQKKIKVPWTTEELEYLDDKWGVMNYHSLAKVLGRTPEAVRMKAIRLGYANFQMSQDGITLIDLARALHIDYKKLRRWIHLYKMPIFSIKVSDKQRKRMINIDSFWKFAKKNSTLIDFSLLEKNSLGAEPTWVADRRKLDYYDDHKKKRNSTWSISEEQQLIGLVNEFKYTYREISLLLKRPEKVIFQKLIDLKVKARPLKAERQKWTVEEITELLEMVRNGTSKAEMAERFKRSETAISGKLRKFKAERVHVGAHH